MLSLEEQFRCLACASIFPSFPRLTSHFLSVHGVPSLLDCPATNAVLLPPSLGSHTCVLCKEGGHGLGQQDVQTRSPWGASKASAA